MKEINTVSFFEASTGDQRHKDINHERTKHRKSHDHHLSYHQRREAHKEYVYLHAFH